MTLNPETPAQGLLRGPALAPALLLVRCGDARRTEVEEFVRRVYAAHHGADVRQFAPSLVALQDEQGEIVAAAGYRAADEEPLFLEHYLSAPVESVLGRTLVQAPERRRIVEVGHLAAGQAGAGRRLILLLGPHLAGQGFQWVVGTLTAELRHLFLRLGVAPLALGVADPALLGSEAARWGRYYEHRPVVLAGHLETALQSLGRQRGSPSGLRMRSQSTARADGGVVSAWGRA